MKPTFKISGAMFFKALFISITLLTAGVYAQDTNSTSIDRDTLLSVARAYIKTVPYCALITTDSTGSPNVRIMDPFQPDENMVVWLGTIRHSRKVREIRNNPRVTLYYSNNKGAGYVSIIGNAVLVDDPEKKTVLWKDVWNNFYKNKEEQYILIKIVPEKLEIINYKHGFYNDPETWGTPSVEFNNAGSKD